MRDLSPQFKWKEQLEKKERKIKKKDLIKVLGSLIKEEYEKDGYYIKATNFVGRDILIHCETKEECMRNLAILNGYTVE